MREGIHVEGGKTVKIATGIKLLENHEPQETLFSSFLPQNPYLETKLWLIVSLKRLGPSTQNLAHKLLFIRTFETIEIQEGQVILQECLKRICIGKNIQCRLYQI